MINEILGYIIIGLMLLIGIGEIIKTFALYYLIKHLKNKK